MAIKIRAFVDKHARILSSFILVLTFLACLVSLRGAAGTPSIRWMYVYHESDFSSLADYARFLAELRAPIPPVLAGLEILFYRLTGGDRFFAVLVYRLVFAFVFSFPLVFAASPWRRMVFAPFCFFLAWGAGIVHHGNPQTYDVYFPALILLFADGLWRVSSTKRELARPAESQEPGPTPSAAGRACPRFGHPDLAAFFSGFSLSMAELLRPFVIFLMPIIVLLSWLALRGARRRFLLFLAPILLFSGSWHVYLAARFGQIAASNHSGINMARSWHELLPERPAMIPEPAGPRKADHWDNLNTAEHAENSRRWQVGVRRFILAHPWAAAKNIARRTASLIAPQIDMYEHQPRRKMMTIYVTLARIITVVFLWRTAVWLSLAVRRRSPSFLGLPILILSFTVLASLFIFAVAEAPIEDARFFITLLPLILTVAIASEPKVCSSE